MSKQAQELKDLAVDRVDGVDRPATGRNFLLFKSVDGKVMKADGDAIMKGYGMVATAADAVLKALRGDSQASVTRKTAIAINGLAQVLGQDAPFVAKSVPTQPYEIDENVDGDKRGPADENLGENFSPRSMPGSMVGSVSFRMKDADGDADDMVEGKGKKKDAAAAPAAAQKDATAEALGSLAKAIEGLVAANKAMPGAIVKALVEGPADVAKSEESEQVETVRPRSRQVQEDEQPARQVRKGRDEYEPRFGVSFADIAFKQ